MYKYVHCENFYVYVSFNMNFICKIFNCSIKNLEHNFFLHEINLFVYVKKIQRNIIGAMDTVAAFEALKKVHTDAEDVFHELYRRASNMRCFTETRRKCEKQKHWANLKADDIETHYMVTISVPSFERVLSEMEARVTIRNKKTFSFGLLLLKLSSQKEVQGKFRKFSTIMSLCFLRSPSSTLRGKLRCGTACGKWKIG